MRSLPVPWATAMSADVAMLKQAIEALYAVGSSEQARNEANAWLMRFAASPNAWEAARLLLDDSVAEVQYFGANLLFTKVRSEWHTLPDTMKASIYQGLRDLIARLIVPAEPGAYAGLSAAGKRLCLTLAAAATRSAALEAFTAEAFSIAASAGGAPVAIELLSALPQEILEKNAGAGAGAGTTPAAGADAPDLHRQESRPELRAALPQVLALLVATIGQGGGARVGACLRCLHQWLSLGMGCSLLHILDTAPALVTAAFTAIASPLAESDVAADAMCELLSPANTVLAPSSEKAVHGTRALADQLSQLVNAMGIAQQIETGNDLDDAPFNACRVLCAFAEVSCPLCPSDPLTLGPSDPWSPHTNRCVRACVRSEPST